MTLQRILGKCDAFLESDERRGKVEKEMSTPQCVHSMLALVYPLRRPHIWRKDAPCRKQTCHSTWESSMSLHPCDYPSSRNRTQRVCIHALPARTGLSSRMRPIQRRGHWGHRNQNQPAKVTQASCHEYGYKWTRLREYLSFNLSEGRFRSKLL